MNALFWFQTSLSASRLSTLLILFSVNRVESGGIEQGNGIYYSKAKLMKYNELGNSGIKVSEICLGSMTWGTQNSEAEGHAQMDYSLANGVNFIDTAEMYPVNPISAQTSGRN